MSKKIPIYFKIYFLDLKWKFHYVALYGGQKIVKSIKTMGLSKVLPPLPPCKPISKNNVFSILKNGNSTYYAFLLGKNLSIKFKKWSCEVLPPKNKIQKESKPSSVLPRLHPSGHPMVYMGHICIKFGSISSYTNKQEAKPSCSRSSIVLGYCEGALLLDR